MITEDQKFDEPAVIETNMEITLSDALADSLVNPPTDQESCPMVVEELNILSDDTGTKIIQDNSDSFPDIEVDKGKELYFLSKESMISKELSDSTYKNDKDNKDIIINDSKYHSLKGNFEELSKSEGAKSTSRVKTKVNAVNDEKLDSEEHAKKNQLLQNFEEKEIPESSAKPENSNHEIEKAVLARKSKENNKLVDKSDNISNQVKVKGDIVKKRKSKRVKKNVILTDCDKEENVNDNLQRHTSTTFEVTIKSYSAATKHSLSKQPNNNLTVSSPPQPVSNSSPLITDQSCSLTKNQSEQDSVTGRESFSPVSTPDIWEQTNRRRKHKRNNKKGDSPCLEKLPDLEVISTNTEQNSLVHDVVIEPQNENIDKDEIESTKKIKAKKMQSRRKRSRPNRRDSEHNNVTNRIMICDDQV